MRTVLATACLMLSVPFALAEEPAPPWLRVGPHTTYDGVTDDLVTGGLGADAMLGNRPGYADPLHSTAAELRRAALFFPGSAGQGFGRLFGPDVDETTGKKLDGRGKIAGEEYLAYADNGEGKQNVAMLLQIPANLSNEQKSSSRSRQWLVEPRFATSSTRSGDCAAAARSSTPTRATATASISWSRIR